jgi:hypothetical protein
MIRMTFGSFGMLRLYLAPIFEISATISSRSHPRVFDCEMICHIIQ